MTAGLGVVTNASTGSSAPRCSATTCRRSVSAFDTLLRRVPAAGAEDLRATQADKTAFLVVAAPDPDALREAAYFVVERLGEDDTPLAGLIVNRASLRPGRCRPTGDGRVGPAPQARAHLAHRGAAAAARRPDLRREAGALRFAARSHRCRCRPGRVLARCQRRMTWSAKYSRSVSSPPTAEPGGGPLLAPEGGTTEMAVGGSCRRPPRSTALRRRGDGAGERSTFPFSRRPRPPLPIWLSGLRPGTRCARGHPAQLGLVPLLPSHTNNWSGYCAAQRAATKRKSSTHMRCPYPSGR